ncbi:hypothetical protein HaLaN_15311 [Haematococcus lacustris]|uniref:Uncharacterized protein n=1 Tax=Haematococcus lacustris TaxID=44745 RepID=A0A699ZI20_HAELA|nr:hypothetical protein HaLaN_15311 [Haematococcus lacustris]
MPAFLNTDTQPLCVSSAIFASSSASLKRTKSSIEGGGLGLADYCPGATRGPAAAAACGTVVCVVAIALSHVSGNSVGGRRPCHERTHAMREP